MQNGNLNKEVWGNRLWKEIETCKRINGEMQNGNLNKKVWGNRPWKLCCKNAFSSIWFGLKFGVNQIILVIRKHKEKNTIYFEK